MKKRMIVGAAVLAAGVAQAAIVITPTFEALADAPTASSTDLGQTAVADPVNDITAVSDDALGAGTRRLGLFNGAVGDGIQDTNADDYVRIDNGHSLTVNFDTSGANNALGYDITGITSIFNWNDRADQGFSVDLGFVGGGTATLLEAGFWGDQDPQDGTTHYSIVTITESGVGSLYSDTVDFGGSSAGTGVTATGVESITFTFNNMRNPSVAAEIDIFGTATIPEPATLGLVAAFGGGILFIRRRFMM